MKENINGKLFPSEITDDELAALLRAFLLTDMGIYRNYRINARKYWELNFNSVHNYSDFLQSLGS